MTTPPRKARQREALHQGVDRRRCIQAAAAIACGAGLGAGPARAQALRRTAVVSFIGDRLVVVHAGPVTGSRLDPNRQHSLPDPAGAMDQFALAAAGRSLEVGGQASAALLALQPSPLHEQAEQWVDGPKVALPGPLVDAVDQSGASHLLLLTKHRADASIPLLNGHLGVGKLHGLGYYVDSAARIRMVESGATGYGLLAAYAYFTLTLADARTGEVLKQRHCSAARAYPVAASKTALDPWDVLPAEQKVARLRSLLERELAREVPLLIAA